MKDKSIMDFLKKMKFTHSMRIMRLGFLMLFIFGLIVMGLVYIELSSSDSFYAVLTIFGPPCVIIGLVFFLFPASKITVSEFIEANAKPNSNPEDVTLFHKIIWGSAILGSIFVGIWDTLFLFGIVNSSFIYIYFIY